MSVDSFIGLVRLYLEEDGLQQQETIVSEGQTLLKQLQLPVSYDTIASTHTFVVNQLKKDLDNINTREIEDIIASNTADLNKNSYIQIQRYGLSEIIAHIQQGKKDRDEIDRLIRFVKQPAYIAGLMRNEMGRHPKVKRETTVAEALLIGLAVGGFTAVIASMKK